jgi:hypothetical protein
MLMSELRGCVKTQEAWENIFSSIDLGLSGVEISRRQRLSHPLPHGEPIRGKETKTRRAIRGP